MRRFIGRKWIAWSLVLGIMATNIFPCSVFAEDLGDGGNTNYCGNDDYAPDCSASDIQENVLEMSLQTVHGEQIKNWSWETTLAYRSIYENLACSTPASWQEWIDWYAGMGYTYTGDTQARISGADRVTVDPYMSYWMWLTKGGKQYWCHLYDMNGTGSYVSNKNGWINIGDANGNNKAWYYINGDNYLIFADGWLNCKVSETNGNHSLRQAGWFYLNSSGQMQTGWHPDQTGKWYYFKIDEAYNTDGAAIKVGESADGHGLVWELDTASPSSLYHLKGVNIRTNLYLMDANGNYSFVPRTSFQSITPFVTSTYYYDANYVNSYLDTGCYNLAYIDKTQFSVYLDNGDYNSYYIPDFTVSLARKNYSVHATKDRGIASVSGEGTYYHGAQVTLSATVKPGYAFVDWKNANDTILSTNPAYTFTVTGITDLKTETKVIPYKITIDYNGGTGDNPTDYNVESEDITLNPPTKPGYAFIGWTGSNSDTPQVDVTISQGTTGDLNYKANWRPNFKIFFDGNGSTSEGENYEVLVESDNFTLPENDRFGIDKYSFQGWSIHNDSRYDSIDGFNGIQKAGDTFVARDFLEYCQANQPDGVEIVDGFYVIHMYAVWDAFPTIKAGEAAVSSAWFDTMTENEIKEMIFENVVGEDTEDGTLVNSQDGLKGVTITDFDMDELRAFQSTGSVSINLRATDGAGNITEKKIRLWVNSKYPIDGAYINRARCINKKFYDAGKTSVGLDKEDPHYLDGYKQGGLMPKDLWYTDVDMARTIEEAFYNLENENWDFSWKFTHEQVLETQDYIEKHGFGDSEEDGALMAYYNRYQDNITINNLPN